MRIAMKPFPILLDTASDATPREGRFEATRPGCAAADAERPRSGARSVPDRSNGARAGAKGMRPTSKCRPDLRRAVVSAVSVVLLLATRHAWGSDPDSGATFSSAEAGEELSGGETTIFDSTRNAFNLPAPNLSEEHRTAWCASP